MTSFFHTRRPRRAIGEKVRVPAKHTLGLLYDPQTEAYRFDLAATDIAWIAGFLEGEGCFATGASGSPMVKVVSTDRDVLEHYGSLVLRPVRGPYIDDRARRKPQWEVNVCGRKAIALMAVLLPYMGLRRAKKIRTVLADAATRELKRPIRIRSLAATCHTDLPRYHTDGRCRNCYERDRRVMRKVDDLWVTCT